MSVGESATPEMFQEGLFEVDEEGPRLLGTFCRRCDRTFYPRTRLCLDCLGEDIEERRLSREGTLECITTVHMPALHIAPPYCVGYVRLADGPRVFAPIEMDGRSAIIGMRLRLADYRLGLGPEKTTAYCFRPG